VGNEEFFHYVYIAGGFTVAFIAMMFAGVALLLFVLGIGEVILGIVLRITNSRKIKKGKEKSRALSIISVLLFVFGGLSLLPVAFIAIYNVSSNIAQENLERNSIEYSVYNNNIEQVRELLEEDTDPNTMEHFIHPPIYLAFENDNYNMMKILLEHGANPDVIGAWDKQVLHSAIEENKLDFVKLLIEYGADINFIVSRRTPLDVAYYIGRGVIDNSETVDFLIENGAKTFQELEK
jgi:hypothetical protein